jgi:hypothetical protein
MISRPFSLPSSTPEVLRGEVQQRIAGKWRVVLTASGHTVVDGFKVPREWQEDVRASAYRTPPTFPRMQRLAEERNGRIYWHH